MKTINKLVDRAVTLLVAVCLLVAFYPQAFGSDPEEGPSDKQITISIGIEYFIQDGVDWNDLDVKTYDGIVTLTGEVESILEKERAVEIAKSIKGVKSVIDLTKVKRHNIADEQIRNQIKQALVLDPATESFEIDVSVEEGNVTLNGEVDSWQEKQLAAMNAKNIKGVRSVTNKLNFSLLTDRTDQEIQAEIEELLKWDIRVNDGDFKVKVKNGHVKLSGAANSASERGHATMKAWVDGVKTVDATAIEIRNLRNEDMIREHYVYRDDEKIKQAIERAFIYDPRVLSFNPDIYVEDGIVTLTGEVATLKAKEAAEIDAKNTAGVVVVRNLLKVKGKHFPSDEVIKENLDSSLKWNPYVDKFALTTTVSNGTAVLKGSVDNYLERYHAEKVANSIYGITNVLNLIEVRTDRLPYVYDYVDDFHESYYKENLSASPKKTDWQILKEIKEQLFWLPNIDATAINIEVNQGKVHLSGQVDNWREYNLVESNAYEGGAIVVENELKVDKK